MLVRLLGGIGMNKQLKTRLTILDGAIDKLNIYETGTQESMSLTVLQEQLRLAVLEWKRDNFELVMKP